MLGDKLPDPCSVSSEHVHLELSLYSEGLDVSTVRPISIGSHGGSVEGLSPSVPEMSLPPHDG
jgi:hypothetical protein